MFLDGHFVPARMLVNGESIYFDQALTEYTYHHVGLAEHGVKTYVPHVADDVTLHIAGAFEKID